MNAANEFGNTALHCAVEESNVNFAKALIGLGARDVANADGKTARDLASLSGDEAMMRLFDSHNKTLFVPQKFKSAPLAAENTVDALNQTIKSSRKEIKSVKVLLENTYTRTVMNSADANGDFSLHAAAKQGDVDALQLLLTYKPNANVLDAAGMTPLLAAASLGLLRIINVLLQYPRTNASLRCPGSGHTALHLLALQPVRGTFSRAITFRDVIDGRVLSENEPATEAIVQKIAAAFADGVNARNSQGDTALHIAVLRDNIEYVRILILLGADPLALNTANQSPLEIARIRGIEAIVNLLSQPRPIPQPLLQPLSQPLPLPQTRESKPASEFEAEIARLRSQIAELQELNQLLMSSKSSAPQGSDANALKSRILLIANERLFVQLDALKPAIEHASTMPDCLAIAKRIKPLRPFVEAISQLLPVSFVPANSPSDDPIESLKTVMLNAIGETEHALRLACIFFSDPSEDEVISIAHLVKNLSSTLK